MIMTEEQLLCARVQKTPPKWQQKWIFVEGEIRGQARVRTIDKLDEARTNADDQMMLVQHYSGDRVMS